MSIAAANLNSVYEFFARGGIFMGFLLFCSLVSVAVILLRGLALRRNLVVPPELEKEIDVLRHDDGDGVARLTKLVRNDHSALGRIASTGLNHLSWPKSENVEAVQTRARHEVTRLESGLFILEVIVGIAPLLGLLGAVSGLVKVFAAFGDAGASNNDQHVIARGISEALSTTIVGLAIAIPSLIAYSYFSRKIEIMAHDIEASVGDLLAKCYFHKQKRYSARISPPPASPYEGDYQGAGAAEEAP